MKHDFLLNFVSLDEQAFEQILHKLGYAAAACYRIEQHELIYFFGSNALHGETWPARVVFNNTYYNANHDRNLPLGWFRPKLSGEAKQLWPKGTLSYFPEQESMASKLVLFLVPKRRVSRPEGSLDGPLEVIMKRISHWINSWDTTNFVNETLFAEHIRRFNLELQTLIDHELRTPLSIISGYSGQLSEAGSDKAQIAHVAKVVAEQADVTVKAIEKLGLVLRSGYEEQFGQAVLESVPLSAMVRAVCESISKEGSLGLQGKSPNFTFVVPHDANLNVNAVPKLLERSILEVVKNAVIHSQKGSIKVAMYRLDDTAVVEVEDDGDGVPVGSDELIFLRFFQGSNTQKLRRGHRGMGLGLFLARHIAEMHMGRLTFVRQSGRGGIFRFIWPLFEAKDESKPVTKKLVS